MKKGLIAVVLLALVALAPLGIKQLNNQVIDDTAKVLQDNGAEFKITDKSSYLQTNKEFTFNVTDGKKFTMFMAKKIAKKFPNYEKILLSLANNPKANTFNEAIKKVYIKGSIEKSNINPNSDMKSNIYLDKFSDDVMKTILAKKNTPFKVILDKKLINFDVVANTSGGIKSIKLKDIKENFNLSYGTSGDISIIGFAIKNQPSSDNLKANFALDKITASVKEKNDDIHVELNKLNYDVDYENTLINTVNSGIDGILITSKNQDGLFKFGKVRLNSLGDKSGDKYNVKFDTQINDFQFKERRKNATLKQIDFKLDLLDADYNSVFEIDKISRMLSIKNIEQVINSGRVTDNYEQLLGEILPHVRTFVNKGFKLNIKASLNNLELENFMKLDNINISFENTLKENKLSETNANQEEALKAIDVKLNIQMSENDYKTISRFDQGIAMMAEGFKKIENGKVIFDAKVKDGKISINGKNIK